MKCPVLTIGLILAAHQSHAVTAQEYMTELANEERVTYVMASAEMAMSIYIDSGSKDKATCIRDWLVNDPSDVMATINRFMSNPDNGKYTAAGIIRILFERQCTPDRQP